MRSTDNAAGNGGEDPSSPRPPAAVTEATCGPRLLAVLDALGEPMLSGLFDDEVRAGITAWLASAERALARALAFVEEADTRDLATAHGAVNTAALVRALAPSPMSSAEAAGLVKQMHRLRRHPEVRTAALAGVVSPAAADAVAAAVETLPTSVGPEIQALAETHLLGEATKLPVKQLTEVGKHLLDVIDPDLADAKLAARLEAEERAAARKTSFRVWHNGQGRSYGKFQIPTFAAIQLEAMLHAIGNPLRDPAHGGIPQVATRELELVDPATGEVTVETQQVFLESPERMGLAFVDLIRRIPATKLPKTGGGVVKVVVTIPVATLMGGLAAAAVHGVNKHRLSPGEARRLACELGVIPMVLNGDSIVLDAGRQQRLHDEHQRTAMIVQQHGTCGINDCERPALWGEAHHPHEWGDGGGTNTQRGVILCPRHHSLAHTNHLRLTRHPDKTWTLERTKRRRP